MMSSLAAVAGLLLVWFTGAAALAAAGAWARRELPLLMLLAYGLPLGWILLVLVLWAHAPLGAGFGLWSAGVPLVLIGTGAGAVWWRARRSSPGAMIALASPPMALWAKALCWLLVLLLAARFTQLTLEVLWRPTFGWDAWAHWATKAKVWYSLGTILPFGSADALLAGKALYTDGNPAYPSGVPLLQVWMALCAGSWDDTLINLPWIAFALALGMGLYAHTRLAGGGPLFSLAVAYALLSLPFLNAHVALPGYADLPLALFVGLFSMAFWRWSVTRDAMQLALTLILALAAPLVKTPGWVWAGLLLPAALPVLLGRRGWKLLLVLALTGAVTLFVLAQYHPRVLGYELHARFQPVWWPLLQTLFAFANWHLLWCAAPVLALSAWRVLASARFAALSAYLAGGLGFLFVVFFFSNAALWVTDLSTVNRALMHLVPSLVFFCALLALHWRERLAARSAPEVIPAPPAAPSDARPD